MANPEPSGESERFQAACACRAQPRRTESLPPAAQLIDARNDTLESLLLLGILQARREQLQVGIELHGCIDGIPQMLDGLD
jgi:hypothetical protein